MARLNLSIGEEFRALCESMRRPMSVQAKIILDAWARDAAVQRAVEKSEAGRIWPASEPGYGGQR